MGEIKTLNIGILGTGRMAAVMAKAIASMKHETAVAVGSRSLEKAQAFAKEYGISKAYGSYEELCKDPEVDLIYVVSPHSHHLEHGALCMEAGKPVLVEKSFTANAAQAKQLIDLAEEKKVFLAEAIWTRYMPFVKTMKEVLASGKIGEVRSASANLGYYTVTNPRVVEPALAGGALLDVGIYCLTFFSILFGDNAAVLKAEAHKSEKGIDLNSSVLMTLETEDGREVPCSFYSSVDGPTDRRGIIYGSKGYMEIGNVNNYEYIEIFNNSHQRIERIDRPAQEETGYVYQFEACRKALSEGKTETAEMPHAEILAVMELMDRIRKEMGVRYPFE